MKTLLKFALTKTAILRYVAGILASLLIGWGAVQSENKEVLAGAITTFITLVVSGLIEKKKDDDVMVIQHDVGAKADGWAGPATRQDVSTHTLSSRSRAARRSSHLHVALAFLLPAFLFTGCAAGDRFYAVGTATNPDGTTLSRPVIVASLNRDAAGNVSYEGHGHKYSVTLPDGWVGQTVTRRVFDKKGVLIGEETTPVIAGASTSRVITATGDAVAKVTEAGGNLVMKGAATTAAAAMAGPAVGLIPK